MLQPNPYQTRPCLTVPAKRYKVNASWKDTFVRQYKTFDVNVMIGVGDGLVAPVVKDVGGKGLKAISDDVKALASSAQAMELEPHQAMFFFFFFHLVGAVFHPIAVFSPLDRTRWCLFLCVCWCLLVLLLLLLLLPWLWLTRRLAYLQALA